jgi:predicted FMN-binding regulatory protein PaiB
MMTNQRFSARSDEDTTRFISANPLAFVVTGNAGDADATLLPLRPEQVNAGRLATLTGHYPRTNPQVAQLQADSRATLLFLGPHGYVSPSWFADRTQAPTWNYATANLGVRIEFLDTPEDLDRIVRDLVDSMERGRERHWSVDEMHARYALLLQRIIPFRATVLDIRAKFKLGQDERDDTFPEIMQGLAAAGNAALIAMMRDFNSQRGAGSVS